MTTALKPQWIKPGTILFAATVPVNETAFRFALAQATEFKASLVLFHAYDTLAVTSSEASGILYFDYDAARHEAMKSLDPLAERARTAGVPCRIEVRTGLPAEQILAFARDHAVDRVVMATRSPGAIGKLFVGSVAEEVLRKAPVPVCVIGPNVVDGAYRRYAVRKVLCGVRKLATSAPITTFAAEVAEQYAAQLTLLHILRPEQFRMVLAGHVAAQMERELQAMLPPRLAAVKTESIVVLGDPAEELLFRARATLADLIILGAHEASMLATVARTGVAYKVIASAECPVLTLSPAVLAAAAEASAKEDPYLAGVF